MAQIWANMDFFIDYREYQPGEEPYQWDTSGATVATLAL